MNRRHVLQAVLSYLWISNSAPPMTLRERVEARYDWARGGDTISQSHREETISDVIEHIELQPDQEAKILGYLDEYIADCKAAGGEFYT